MSNEYKEIRKAFTYIYENNLWEFGSGIGSLPETTLEYRYFLETFIAKNSIRSVVDFGCGDWNFSRFIHWWNADYTGYDTVESVIQNNTKQFSTDAIHFLVSPENFTDICCGELLIVKDVLQHWPNDTIDAFLAAVKGKFRQILITNSQYPERDVNKDIRIGQFRPVDLRTPPFNLQAELAFSYTIRCTTASGNDCFDIKNVLLLQNW